MPFYFAGSCSEGQPPASRGHKQPLKDSEPWRKLAPADQHLCGEVQRGVCVLSCVRLSATTQTEACQAPLPMGFFLSRILSGLPFSSPGDLPDPGIEPVSPALQADSSLLSHLGSPKFKELYF